MLVPPQHSLDVRSKPAALMTLNEGGQLIVYDMKTLKPLPLFLPLQELPPILHLLPARCAPSRGGLSKLDPGHDRALS